MNSIKKRLTQAQILVFDKLR